MISNIELAKKLDSTLQSIMRALDDTVAVVRKEAPLEGDRYATAVGTVFMCIYEQILDPIYVKHPEIAPTLWRES
jgi:hypothetical protein